MSMSQNFQNATLNEAGQPDQFNALRTVTNRNVMDLATLTVGEMRDMSTMSPN